MHQLLIYPVVEVPKVDGEFLYDSYKGGSALMPVARLL